MPYRATFIYITQTDWAVSSYTNTSEGIWLLTATEQLWSVASINDISANATPAHPPKKKKKKNGRKKNGSKVRAHWRQTNKCYGNSGSVQALHISVHQDSQDSILKFKHSRLNTHISPCLSAKAKEPPERVCVLAYVENNSFLSNGSILLVVTFHGVK